jgi:hypothetical protein
MKRIIIFLLILAGSLEFASTASGQKTMELRLNGYGLYALDDNHVDSYTSSSSYFYGEIEGGFEYGVGFEILPAASWGFDFSYLRLASGANVLYYNGGSLEAEYDLKSNYLLLGASKYFRMKRKTEPYAGLQAGMVIFDVFDPYSGYSGSGTKFAWGIRGGANIWLNKKIAVKIQTGLLSAVQAMGGNLYNGTTGSGTGISGPSTFYQLSVGGGLLFNLR